MSPETLQNLLYYLGLATVIFPAALVAMIGLPTLLGYKLSERLIARATQVAVVGGLLCSIAILAFMLTHNEIKHAFDLKDWVSLPGAHFHLHFSFVFDRLSVPFVILTYVLVGTIGAFASRYLHRESGYTRFFLLNAVFLFGMIVAITSATIETLFLGWELVGLSSALLVAYFHERISPVVNGQRVWAMYRVADAAFLLAAVELHRLPGAGSFDRLMGSEAWPLGKTTLSPAEDIVIGLLLLIAVAGKSALIPFSGWLPRAMEGPTPSSAIFYGALSVHLGAFMLLRISPLLDMSLLLSAIVVILGLATAVYAALCSRVQSDVKTALAFASLTQVGIITAEIGLGLRYIALIHIIGHACLRTLQLIRAPNLLHDYHALENAIGDHLPEEEGFFATWIPRRYRLAIYRFSLNRGNFDSLIDQYLVRPFLGVFRVCDSLERKWTDTLAGAELPARSENPAPLPEEQHA